MQTNISDLLLKNCSPVENKVNEWTHELVWSWVQSKIPLVPQLIRKEHAHVRANVRIYGYIQFVSWPILVSDLIQTGLFGLTCLHKLTSFQHYITILTFAILLLYKPSYNSTYFCTCNVSTSGNRFVQFWELMILAGCTSPSSCFVRICKSFVYCLTDYARFHHIQ
jgi:hypothetical protein